MRRLSYFFILAGALLFLSVTATSCFKEEPLNAEADIEEAYVEVDDFASLFFNETDKRVEVLSTDDRIVFNVRGGADLSAIALHFKLTDGATVSPASGSVHDFGESDVVYTVTSQDGNWQRRYTVHFNRVSHVVTDVIEFNFDHYELYKSGRSYYYIWHNVLEDGTLGDDWASGNPGFKLSRSTAESDEYPTVYDPNGYDGGPCVRLTTRDTGSLGVSQGKPIAAGNLYLGKFDLSKALSETLKATRFGIPFAHKPVRMTGYYKYKPGAMYLEGQGKGKDPIERPDKIDSGDIYAVLYRNHDSEGNEIVLFGDDVLTNPNIVAIARITKTETTSQWTPFDLAFDYNGNVIDENILAAQGYNLIICFSSSIDGASFNGAIGSELFIDKVKIYTEREED